VPQCAAANHRPANCRDICGRGHTCGNFGLLRYRTSPRLEGCKMSAAAPVRTDHSQDTKRVIAFGGTGKTVALIYRKIGRLLGENANIVICDFPPSGDYNSSDGRLDRDLASEGVAQQCRINTLPDALPAVPNRLVETFRLPSALADALFTKKQ